MSIVTSVDAFIACKREREGGRKVFGGIRGSLLHGHLLSRDGSLLFLTENMSTLGFSSLFILSFSFFTSVLRSLLEGSLLVCTVRLCR